MYTRNLADKNFILFYFILFLIPCLRAHAYEFIAIVIYTITFVCKPYDAIFDF